MLKLEKFAFGIISLLLIAIVVLFDPHLGNTYFVIAAGGIVLMILDYIWYNKKISILIERTYNPLKDIFWAVIGIFGVFIIGAFIRAVDFNSIVKLFAGRTPYFSQNPWFGWLAYGLGVAIIETIILWGPFLEFICDILKINKFNSSDLRVWGVLIFISIGFMLLHLTVYGGDWNQLATVLVMGIITSIIVVINNFETKAAAMMHIALNSIAILVEKNIFDVIPAIIFSIVVISLISYSTKYFADLKSKVGN